MDINKKIIFNLFSDKLTPLEKRAVEQWLSYPANKELYFRWMEEWEAQNKIYNPNDNIHLHQKSKTQLEAIEKHPASTSNKPKRKSTNTWVPVAVVLLLLGAGILVINLRLLYTTYATGYGEERTLTLNDSTQVTLYPNSQLQMLRWSWGKKRPPVYLEGEATFKVAHTPDNQNFIVKTVNHINIEVLGTEFFVFARERGSNISLHKGKIKIHYKNEQENKSLVVNPGETITFNQKNEKINRPLLMIPTAPTDWKNKRFEFNETTLQEVVQMIEETYNVKVEFDEDMMKDKQLMGSIVANNLKEFVSIIAQLLNVNFEMKDNHVRFYNVP